MISKGADIGVANNDGHKEIDYATAHGLRDIIALLSGEISADTFGNTPLHQAANQGNCFIGKVLLDAKATVNSQNQNGESPLILAAMRGNSDFVSTLIDYNADVNITDNAQHTALYYAAESGFTEIVEVLIMAGAEGY